jgi:hypothetical protein
MGFGILHQVKLKKLDDLTRAGEHSPGYCFILHMNCFAFYPALQKGDLYGKYLMTRQSRKVTG